MVTPADHMPGPGQGHWTYKDYANLPDDGHRYEIVDGVLYMAPSPNRSHQNTAFEIASYLRSHVKLTGLGQVFIAPFDVELNTRTVVQPDVIVLLNHNLDKITFSRIIGAPQEARSIRLICPPRKTTSASVRSAKIKASRRLRVTTVNRRPLSTNRAISSRVVPMSMKTIWPGWIRPTAFFAAACFCCSFLP